MAVAIKLPIGVYKSEDGRWNKPCPVCGENQSYLRRNYAITSYNEKKNCKKCSNSIPDHNGHKGWIRSVLRRSFIRKYEVNAVLRSIEWNISYDYLAGLLIDQDFKCKLTRWEIGAMGVAGNTASLDRIDSSKGYIEDNLQWVHKMVNMCKQQYDQVEFIKMCKSISENTK